MTLIAKLAILNTHHHCPFCLCEDFVIGPRGGVAANILCMGCARKFWYSPPFTPMLINNDSSAYTAAPVNLRTWTQETYGDDGPSTIP